MNPPLTQEVKSEAHKDLMAVLRKHNLPDGINISKAVEALVKEVSCAHQLKGMK
jgi:hypothetical protein